MLKPFLNKTLARWTILIVLVCFTLGCQSEFAKWEFAQAQLIADSGQRDVAIPLMKQAVEKSGNQMGLSLKLAFEMSQLGDPESVAICDRMLADNAELMNNDTRKNVQLLKSHCQQQIGDFAGGLKTFKGVLRDHVARSERELNELAYYRALAQTEMALAARNIGQAIEKMQFKSNWPSGNSLTLAAKAAVANALLARYLDHQGLAPSAAETTLTGPDLTSAYLTSLSRQVEKYESSFYRLKELNAVSAKLQSQSSFQDNLLGQNVTQKANQKATQDATQNVTQLVELNQEHNRSNLATLLTVRALLYQDRGEAAACNRDRYRVQQLNRDSDQIVTQLPSPHQCLDLQELAMIYLDTQGFVQSQLSWREPDGSSYQEAVENLSLAIDSIQLRRRAFTSRLLNNAELPVGQVRATQAEQKRMAAILHYHRMLTHQRAGNGTAATADRQMILELGFEPNDRLF